MFRTLHTATKTTTAVLFAGAASLALTAGSAHAMSHKDGEKGGKAGAKAELTNGKGETIGHVHFAQLTNGVLVHAKLDKLPPGTHAFHIHGTGKCEAPDFKSAGGHYAPRKNNHGLDAAGGPHAGDFPNIHVGGDGELEIEYFNPYVTLRQGEASLFKKGGTAIVIHQGGDDYKSQPSGSAGPRIACGVIEKP